MNFEEFYKEFDVKDGDNMWCLVEKCVIIW